LRACLRNADLMSFSEAARLMPRTSYMVAARRQQGSGVGVCVCVSESGWVADGRTGPARSQAWAAGARPDDAACSPPAALAITQERRARRCFSGAPPLARQAPRPLLPRSQLDGTWCSRRKRNIAYSPARERVAGVDLRDFWLYRAHDRSATSIFDGVWPSWPRMQLSVCGGRVPCSVWLHNQISSVVRPRGWRSALGLFGCGSRRMMSHRQPAAATSPNPGFGLLQMKGQNDAGQVAHADKNERTAPLLW
jgi:hypothetical protein